MCGFAVAIDWPDAELVVQRMIEGIFHRGDVSDPVLVPRSRCAMATRRLRIVDPANAVQPQISFDGKLAVSFNGELYNHLELRRELERAGIPFRTDCDTEVLANALRLWGERALERLEGMYAFVAIDIASGEFLAARDVFGVKPLYLIQGGAGLCFCSEIRPLLDAVESGEVLLLPPGHFLSATRFESFASSFVARGERTGSDARALDAVLREAVRVRLPADLPVATMFSGGIDSTLVAHYARQFRPEAPGYFVGGASAPDYPFAAAYADRTGFDLRFVPFDADSDEVFSTIDHVVAVTESFEPNLVRGGACSLAVAKAMNRDGFRVALCGEGADELFCGYAPLEIAFHDQDGRAEALREECLGLMHRVSLQRVDRCAMQHQVEAREPFLDPAVVRHALALDGAALVRERGGLAVGKAPLRDLYDLYPSELPAVIRDRTKVPFSEGAGLDVSPQDSAWKMRFEDAISDLDLLEGRAEYAAFGIQTKEELFYLRSLARSMDVSRVPHLRGRAWISFPVQEYAGRLAAYAYSSL